MAEKLAYSLDEAAEALSLSRSAVKELVYRGTLKSKRVGRRRIIPRQALDDFLSGDDNPLSGPDTDWNRLLNGE